MTAEDNTDSPPPPRPQKEAWNFGRSLDMLMAVAERRLRIDHQQGEQSRRNTPDGEGVDAPDPNMPR